MRNIIKLSIFILLFSGIITGSAASNPLGFNPRQFFNNVINPQPIPTPTLSTNTFSFSNITKGIIGGTIALYGLYALKHYYNLHKIDNWLTNSSPIVKNNNDFRFSGWLQDTYKDASSLYFYAPKVKEALGKQLSSKEFQFKKIEDVKNQINKEIRAVENDLEYLTNLTNFPHLLLVAANNKLGFFDVDNDCLSNKILVHCNQSTQYFEPLQYFESLIDNVKTYLEENMGIIDRILYRPINIENNNNNVYSTQSQEATAARPKEKEKEYENKEHPDYTFIKNIKYTYTSSFWPLISTKYATQMYYKTLRRYLRLLVLKDIVSNFGEK